MHSRMFIPSRHPLTCLCCETFIYGPNPNSIGDTAMTAWEKFVARVLKLSNQEWHDRWVALCVAERLKGTRGT